MRERELHDQFIAWLNKHQVPYLHSRMDCRTTVAVGEPDFYVFWMSRVLAIECKVGKNQLSPEQEKRIAYLRRSGNKVVVCRSIEECIDACHNILCIKDCPRGFDADYSEQFKEMKETVLNGGLNAVPPLTERRSTADAVQPPVNGTKHQFLGKVGSTMWVLYGTGQPGDITDMVRVATPQDMQELRQA